MLLSSHKVLFLCLLRYDAKLNTALLVLLALFARGLS